MINAIKEIRLAGQRESLNWSRDKEEKFPETKGETVTIIDVSAICVVRFRGYGCTIAALAKLVEIAQQDFPELKPEDIRVVHFGGISYKGTFGIEFDCPGNPSVAPNGWQPIRELEYTL